MDYQLVLEFSRFLLFQLGVLGLLMLTASRSKRSNKRGIHDDYQEVLKSYRLTGIISYCQLSQLFRRYSRYSLMKLIKERSQRGDLERSLVTHVYKACELHERDMLLMSRFPFLKRFVLRRILSLNLKVTDFESPSLNMEELILIKERVLDETVSIDNTLVLINESEQSAHLKTILSLLSREKMSLLVFSFEKIKSFKVQKDFAEIALRKLPFLNDYLVESMCGSKHQRLRTKGRHYQLQKTLNRLSHSLVSRSFNMGKSDQFIVEKTRI